MWNSLLHWRRPHTSDDRGMFVVPNRDNRGIVQVRTTLSRDGTPPAGVPAMFDNCQWCSIRFGAQKAPHTHFSDPIPFMANRTPTRPDWLSTLGDDIMICAAPYRIETWTAPLPRCPDRGFWFRELLLPRRLAGGSPRYARNDVWGIVGYAQCVGSPGLAHYQRPDQKCEDVDTLESRKGI